MLIGNDSIPLFWNNHIKSHFGFQIRLIEHREHSAAKIRLKVSEQVLAIIDIGKTGTASSIVIILVDVNDLNVIRTKH